MVGAVELANMLYIMFMKQYIIMITWYRECVFSVHWYLL